MTFELTDWMLYSMWIVLGLMGLDFLAGLYKAVTSRAYSSSLITSYLQDLVMYVFPLLLLVNMMPLDHTEWLIKIAYYVGAAGVALKSLAGIKKKL